MKRNLAFYLLMVFGTHAYANSLKVTGGIGLQNGGVVGAQFSYLDDSAKYFATIGFYGVNAGFKKSVSENTKHSLGINIGASVLATEGYASLNYDYHLNGFRETGFTMGISLSKSFIGKANSNQFEGIQTGKVEALLSIGYQF